MKTIEIWEEYKKQSQIKHKIARNALDYLAQILKTGIYNETELRDFIEKNDKDWSNGSEIVSKLELWKLELKS